MTARPARVSFGHRATAPPRRRTLGARTRIGRSRGPLQPTAPSHRSAPRWAQVLRHRLQWLDGGLALSRALLSPPLRDPELCALRPLLTSDTPAPLPPHAAPHAGRLAELASRHELEVLSAALFPALAPHLPAIEQHRRADAILELATLELADTLARAPTLTPTVALLKGSASAALVYPHTSWRHRRDLDLLAGDRLPEVRARLLAHGWRDAVTPQRQAEGPDRVRTWPMTKAFGPFGVSLDLHRRIEATPWCHLAPDALLADAVRDRSALPITSADDTFLVTVAHLVGSGLHEPLKGWVDLARLAPHLSPAFAPRARRFGLATAAHFALGVVARWFHLDTAARGHDLAPRPLQAHLIAHLGAGDHDTPERRPLYKGLSQRLWRRLLQDPSR